MFDEFFEEDTALLEIIFGQAANRGKSGGKFGRFADERHADAAATRCALDHDRIANAQSFGPGVLFIAKQFRAG